MLEISQCKNTFISRAPVVILSDFNQLFMLVLNKRAKVTDTGDSFPRVKAAGAFS
jgi:hypothetical protein